MWSFIIEIVSMGYRKSSDKETGTYKFPRKYICLNCGRVEDENIIWRERYEKQEGVERKAKAKEMYDEYKKHKEVNGE